eukprot:TRINITY_DN27597_c0_g1_i1.p1 TRINITY_DN27597_c0_g1~~TRINITY_DN27597_c0_g1_i1.p1  ORF type:complete len:355 (+),score=111.84 TRINITY_DN27597_c0_g1_i1:131-1195(+)
MSAAGDEFMKELWRGKVPVQFDLASDSLAGMEFERPTGFYKLLPRVSYLSFCATELRDHFKHCVVQRSGADTEMWISRDVDNKPIPVRWHYPVGVIFDSLVLAEGKQAVELLPLRLLVHFSSIPDKQGASAMPEEDGTSAVLSQHLKESHALRYGSSSTVTNLPMTQWQDLVSSVKDCNHTQFSAVRAQLKKRNDGDSTQLAIMVHYNDAVWVRKAAAAPTTEASQTLKQFLDTVLPAGVVLAYGDETEQGGDEGATSTHVDPAVPTGDASVAEEGDAGTADAEGASPSASPEAGGGAAEAGGATSRKPNATFLIQGVVPSSETPLVWLTEYMAHPDGFLHIVVSTADRDKPAA